jgi:hypothetical protein
MLGRPQSGQRAVAQDEHALALLAQGLGVQVNGGV